MRRILLALLCCSAMAGGSIEAGRVKSASCVACHLEDGNSVNPEWPKIAGQHEYYLREQIRYIREGEQGPRSNPLMYPFVMNLTDQDIDDLAAYFAAQERTNGPAVSAQYATIGEKIYRGGIADRGVPACSACHGPSGQGNSLARYPRIAGQHAKYMVDQLIKYRDKDRTTSPNMIMNMIAFKLTEDEMQAVSEYVQAMHEKEHE